MADKKKGGITMADPVSMIDTSDILTHDIDYGEEFGTSEEFTDRLMVLGLLEYADEHELALKVKHPFSIGWIVADFQKDSSK